MNILSIGNSFSSDAQRYIKALADASGVELYNENLYIGGCSLERHFKNLNENRSEYLLEIYGKSDERYVSIDEALASRTWDVITLQQASNKSFDFASYEPYLSELVAHIRNKCPNAKIAIHETWAYADGTDKLDGLLIYKSAENMFTDVKRTYDIAMKRVGADIFIPAGEIMLDLYNRGCRMHRDGFHASLGLGRYAIGLVWIKTLFGIDTTPKKSIALDEEVEDGLLLLAEERAREIVKKYI